MLRERKVIPRLSSSMPSADHFDADTFRVERNSPANPSQVIPTSLGLVLCSSKSNLGETLAIPRSSPALARLGVAVSMGLLQASAIDTFFFNTGSRVIQLPKVKPPQQTSVLPNASLPIVLKCGSWIYQVTSLSKPLASEYSNLIV